MDERFLAELLEKRGTPLPAATRTALALLTDNNPRETLRLADIVLREGTAGDVSCAVATVMREEVQAFRARAFSTVQRVPDGLSDAECHKIAALLYDSDFLPDRFITTARKLMGEWSSEWAGAPWPAHQPTGWRHLLIRLGVAARQPRHYKAVLTEM